MRACSSRITSSPTTETTGRLPSRKMSRCRLYARRISSSAAVRGTPSTS
jgi:hypothetical protein